MNRFILSDRFRSFLTDLEFDRQDREWDDTEHFLVEPQQDWFPQIEPLEPDEIEELYREYGDPGA